MTMKTSGHMRTARRQAQAGMSLVELLIAMLVLAVGMAGVLVMITSGIASNNRNKMDTTATNLSQMVLEEIISKPAGSNPVLTIQDCRPAALGGPQNLQINTAGAAAPAGAGAQILSPAAGGNGDIDWINQAAAAVPADYSMIYFVCGTANREVSYEIRWNIVSPVINIAGAPSKLVTVSARKSGLVGGTDIKTFAPPVTLRSFAGR